MNACTETIGRYATTKLLRKIDRQIMRVPEQMTIAIRETEASMMEWLYRHNRAVFRLVPDDQFMEMVSLHLAMLQELYRWLNALDMKQLQLEQVELEENKANLQRSKLLNQLQALINRWELFMQESPFSSLRVNWAEADPDRFYYALKSTPLNVAELLHNSLWQEKTGILTSATLSVNQQLKYCIQELGIPESRSEILPSPFNTLKQSILYLPAHLPEPSDWQYPMVSVEEMERLVHLNQGRTFILFTSYQAMRFAAERLIPIWPYPSKVQGELPRNRLIQWFKDTPNSVLFATATFWEGIDIPGEALSCVIIDKLPFNAPDDPVHQAQVDYVKQQGRDWFRDFVLPQATIRLKQGVGRLIRTQYDTGIVAILDSRLLKKGYGKTMIKSLPPMHLAKTWLELKAAKEALP
jgi:ATP-dependent DNA helicase DinG